MAFNITVIFRPVVGVFTTGIFQHRFPTGEPAETKASEISVTEKNSQKISDAIKEHELKNDLNYKSLQERILSFKR